MIRNATIVDGTGRMRFRTDVGLAGGRIAAMGSLVHAQAREVVDASGFVVAPGFIDMHTHSDVTLLDDPGGESKIHQGVTTEVVGNCAFSPFPAGDAGPAGLQQALGSILPSRVEWGWSTLDGWARCLEGQGTSLNVVPLVGHAALRVAAGALAESPPTPDQLRAMERLAGEALEQCARLHGPADESFKGLRGFGQQQAPPPRSLRATCAGRLHFLRMTLAYERVEASDVEWLTLPVIA